MGLVIKDSMLLKQATKLNGGMIWQATNQFRILRKGIAFGSGTTYNDELQQLWRGGSWGEDWRPVPIVHDPEPKEIPQSCEQ